MNYLIDVLTGIIGSPDDSTYLTVLNTQAQIILDAIRYNVSPSFSVPVFIPWDYICSVLVLCVFLVCTFKLLRSVICKIL